MRSSSSAKGSVLLAALILSVAIAVVVGSFISLSLGTVRNSTRSAHFNNAVNVAEAGLEQAMWALNNGFDKSPLSTSWVAGGTAEHPSQTRTGDMTNHDFPDLRGSYSIHIENAFTVKQFQTEIQSLKALGKTTSEIQDWITDHLPVIHARGSVQPPIGGRITRELKLRLGIRSPWDNGMVGRTRIDLNGGDIGSYDSLVGSTVPTSLATMGYGITVASPTSVIGDIAIGTPADIKGHLSVGIGASDSAAFLATIKGSLTGPTTPSGTSIDPNLVSYDFSQSYDDVSVPTAADLAALTGLTVTNHSSFPAAKTTGANIGWTVIGDPSGAIIQRYVIAGNMAGTSKDPLNLLVVGRVEIVVTGNLNPDGVFVLDGTKAVPQIDKNGKVTSTTDTTSGKGLAEVYVGGAITLNGAPGTLNADSRPPLFKIFSTLSRAMYDAGNTQTITLNGDANITALIYAPYATVKFNGGGVKGFFAGALIANTITIGGNKYPFVYDVSASNEDITGFRLERWIEFVKGPDPVAY